MTSQSIGQGSLYLPQGQYIATAGGSATTQDAASPSQPPVAPSPHPQGRHRPAWLRLLGSPTVNRQIDAFENDFIPLLKEWNDLHDTENHWPISRFIEMISTCCDQLRREMKCEWVGKSALIEEYTFALAPEGGDKRLGPFTFWRIIKNDGAVYLRVVPSADPDQNKREALQRHMWTKAGRRRITALPRETKLTQWTNAYFNGNKAYNDWQRYEEEFQDVFDGWNKGLQIPWSGSRLLRLISESCDDMLFNGRYLAINDKDPDGPYPSNQVSVIRQPCRIIECMVTLEDPVRGLAVGPFAVWQMVTDSDTVILRRAPPMPSGFENLRLGILRGFKSLPPEVLQRSTGFGHLHPVSFLHALIDAGLHYLFLQPHVSDIPGQSSRTLTEDESTALMQFRHERYVLLACMHKAAHASAVGKKRCADHSSHGESVAQAGPSEPPAKHRRV